MKYILFALAIALSLGLSQPAHAIFGYGNRGTTSTSSMMRRGPQNVATTGTSSRPMPRFEEARKQYVMRLFEAMKNRFDARIRNLRNIADRIDSRIEKIEAETALDLAEASGFVDDAREHIDLAEEALGDLSVDVDDLFDDDATAKDRFQTLRGKFEEAKEHLMEAWTALRSAVSSIKEVRQTATTTDSN